MFEASSEMKLYDLHKVNEELQEVEEFTVPIQNIVLNNLVNDDPLSEASSDSFVDLNSDDSSYFSE